MVLNDPVPNILATRAPGLSPPASPPTGSIVQPSFPLVLRRWDGRGDANAIYSDTSTPAMNLGDGVHIQFGGSNLRAGDYWNFTTRSADGSIESLTNAPPAGIARHRCPLAVVSFGPPPLGSPPTSPPQHASPTGLVMTVLQDCRNLFRRSFISPPSKMASMSPACSSSIQFNPERQRRWPMTRLCRSARSGESRCNVMQKSIRLASHTPPAI